MRELKWSQRSAKADIDIWRPSTSAKHRLVRSIHTTKSTERKPVWCQHSTASRQSVWKQCCITTATTAVTKSIWSKSDAAEPTRGHKSLWIHADFTTTTSHQSVRTTTIKYKCRIKLVRQPAKHTVHQPATTTDVSLWWGLNLWPEPCRLIIVSLFGNP